METRTNQTATLRQLLNEKITLEDLSEFADTEEREIQVALDAGIKAVVASRNKRRMAKVQADYYEKMQRKENAPKFDYEQLKARIQYLYPKFKIDQWNQKEFEKLCMYFSGYPEMSKHGLTPQKGIMLMGNVGIGKTDLMRMFAHNQIQTYMVAECRGIAKDYSALGVTALDKFKEPITTWHAGNIFMHDKFGVCFDDLGTEDEKKYFGNNENVMTDLILNRYSSLTISRQMTHVTTNLTGEEILQKYGTRVNDRLKEMFNVITFPKEAPSRRK